MAHCFISYSHLDEEFKNEFLNHLGFLEMAKLITSWNDRQILPGGDWESEIHSELNKSDVIFLLISPNFVASKYCYGIEFQEAKRLSVEKGVDIVPVIITHCAWQVLPISRVNLLPKDGKPIDKKDNHAAWTEVVHRVKDLVIDRGKRRSKISVPDMEIGSPQMKLIVDQFVIGYGDAAQESPVWDLFVKNLMVELRFAQAVDDKNVVAAFQRVVREFSLGDDQGAVANLEVVRIALYNTFSKQNDSKNIESQTRRAIERIAVLLYVLVATKIVNVEGAKSHLVENHGIIHWGNEPSFLCALVVSALMGGALDIVHDRRVRESLSISGANSCLVECGGADSITDQLELTVLRSLGSELAKFDANADVLSLYGDASGSVDGLYRFIRARLKQLLRIQKESVSIIFAGEAVGNESVVQSAQKISKFGVPLFLKTAEQGNHFADLFLGMSVEDFVDDTQHFFAELKEFK